MVAGTNELNTVLNLNFYARFARSNDFSKYIQER